MDHDYQEKDNEEDDDGWDAEESGSNKSMAGESDGNDQDDSIRSYNKEEVLNV